MRFSRAGRCRGRPGCGSRGCCQRPGSFRLRGTDLSLSSPSLPEVGDGTSLRKTLHSLRQGRLRASRKMKSQTVPLRDVLDSQKRSRRPRLGRNRRPRLRRSAGSRSSGRKQITGRVVDTDGLGHRARARPPAATSRTASTLWNAPHVATRLRRSSSQVFADSTVYAGDKAAHGHGEDRRPAAFQLRASNRRGRAGGGDQQRLPSPGSACNRATGKGLRGLDQGLEFQIAFRRRRFRAMLRRAAGSHASRDLAVTDA